MSVQTNIAVSSIYTSYGPLGYTGRPQGGVGNVPQVQALIDAYRNLGQQVNFAGAFANLPAAPMPHPPMSQVSLQQAFAMFSKFLSQIEGMGRRNRLGYQQGLGLQAMGNLVGKHLSVQGQFGQQTAAKVGFVNEFPGAPPVYPNPTGGKRITKDEFGTGLGAGKGHTSNLANSPEVVLALHKELKGKKLIKMKDLQKTLKDKYGIESELTKIDGRKALKFANGDHVVDANGNGGLDMKDYKFKGAIDNIKKQYGLTDEDVKNFGSKPIAQTQASYGQAVSQLQVQGSNKSGWYNQQYSNMDMRAFDQIFALAMMFAQQ